MKKMGFLEMFKYLPVVALTIGILVVFFAGDTYRYPCQDPANWNSAECEPPTCTASATCPANLVTMNGETVTAEELAAMVDEIEASQQAVSIKPATTTETTPLYEEVK
jgi:hypothetical protein